jgi:phenylalanyl-tRNA synthetase alpha chain
VADTKYNFDYLNIPESHPTRDISETFYLSNNNITLRTQTTSHSATVMENNKNQEIRYAIPG